MLMNSTCCYITLWYSCAMSIFCTKWFKKWSKKSNLKDQDLIEAVANMKAGLSSSELGSHLFKIRVKRPHSGKS